MRSKKKTATSILVVLLIYVFMAGNTSGELALCIGANGHVALEPAIHEHCHNHTHIEQNDPSSLGHEHDGHLESPHCKPCIDIPIFIGPTDNLVPLKPVKPNSETLISLLEPAAISDYKFILPAIPRRFYSATDENRFLRSIILLV
ncbi:MAG: hypothetical protein A2Z38_05205 [Planctomycetes bacterium RBG_19FT_COMBO_48_8]|nr:MAG: hypothetical protein A2Z38_05205 [Planctomycetes bacterium RBG_19FT_COMBO_48_8]